MKKLKALMNLFVLFVVLLSVTGCCLGIAALFGLATYAFIQKYGQLIYFADFWAMTGAKDMANRIHEDLMRYKNNPLLLPFPDAEGVFTVLGKVSYDDPSVVGQYAKYSSKGQPLDYTLKFRYDGGQFVFVKMILDGKITVSDHAFDEAVFEKPQFITFEKTSVSQEGVVLEGIIKVGDRVLDLAQYGDLIAQFPKQVE